MNKNTPSRHPYNFESLFLKLPTNSFPGFYARPWICTCKNRVICILWFLVVWSDSLLRRKRTTKIVNESSPTSKCGRRLRGVARRILLKTKQKVRMKICLNFKLLSEWRSGVEIYNFELWLKMFRSRSHQAMAYWHLRSKTQIFTEDFNS